MQALPMKRYLSQLSKYNVVCQCGHHTAFIYNYFKGRIAYNEIVLVSGCLPTEAKGQLAQARCYKQCD